MKRSHQFLAGLVMLVGAPVLVPMLAIGAAVAIVALYGAFTIGFFMGETKIEWTK